MDLAFLPDGISLLAAGILVLASFFTSALTAAFGLGGGLAMLALLGLFIPVSALIPVHGLVQLGSNTGRAFNQRAHVRQSILGPFALGTVLGAAAGAAIVVQLPDAPLKLTLGLFIIALTWAKIPGFDRLGKAGLAAGALVLAFLSMFLGATGPLAQAFFGQLISDDRKALIATHAAAMTLQHGLKVGAFMLAGFAFADWIVLVAAMIASGYLGTMTGTVLLERIDEASFRKWFRIGLTLLGLDLARRGLAGLVWPSF
ncbi:MAG: TSUP family transporter [Rhizobiaceae bacterium]